MLNRDIYNRTRLLNLYLPTPTLKKHIALNVWVGKVPNNTYHTYLHINRKKSIRIIQIKIEKAKIEQRYVHNRIKKTEHNIAQNVYELWKLN